MSAPETGDALRPALADLDVLHHRGAAASRPPRPLLPRLLLALLVLGGLAALYSAFLDPLLFPPREVRLAPVREMKGAAASARRSVAAAAGWLEAEPYPLTVRPLVAGVVERLDVLEGQSVKRGETVIAVLRSLDLENALAVAEADVVAKTARADLAAQRRVRAVALLEQKLDLRAALLAAERESRAATEAVGEAEAELAHAEAEVALADVELEAQRVLKGTGGTAPLALRTAELRLDQQRAHRGVAGGVLARMRAVADVRARERGLAEEALADPRVLQNEAAVAVVECALAHAEQQAAEVVARVARERVERLIVRAPADGVVQRLLASVGSPVGPDSFTSRELTTVGVGSTGALDTAMGGLALLYDPAHLQARVEVPVADVSAIGPGTEVALEVDIARGRSFRGEVLRLVGEANIQNNKLWVKVRLLESDPLLRPEMLCRAKFLAKAEAPGEAVAGRPRLEVPSAALVGDTVFVLDPTRGGRARRVTVLRRGEAEGFTEVEGTLGLSNEVILDPQGLEDGAKVRFVR